MTADGAAGHPQPDGPARQRRDLPPHVTAKSLARDLAVDLELINGLCAGGQIKAEKAQGKTGAVVWLVHRDEARRVKATVRGLK